MLEIDLSRRGLWKGYFVIDNKKDLEKYAFVWVDKDRRYFISNTSLSKPGITYVMYRIRQVDNIYNADPVRVEFDINQPRVSERYYSRNLNIDERNLTRQDDLKLERKIHNKDWSIRVNNSILGMYDVDTYYLGKACEW